MQTWKRIFGIYKRLIFFAQSLRPTGCEENLVDQALTGRHGLKVQPYSKGPAVSAISRAWHASATFETDRSDSRFRPTIDKSVADLTLVEKVEKAKRHASTALPFPLCLC
jgi:hypothetical protein